jgi:hypothetical protein
MKQHTILFLVLSTLLFSACQEVIEIDLNSSNPAVVVEGNIALGKKAILQLSYTSNYFNTETARKIENATVTLTNSKGESEQLTHSGNGRYIGEKLVGEANSTYQLNVKLADDEINGETSIPSKIELLGVTFTESSMDRPSRPGGDNNGTPSKSYQMQLSFTDDPEQENYYLFKISNSQRQFFNRNAMTTDQLLPQTGVINYSPMMSQFHALDTVSITIYSMDKKNYAFYNQLSDISGGGMAGMSTPYNPESNMGYNVLGYFSAWSVIDTTFIFVP